MAARSVEARPGPHHRAIWRRHLRADPLSALRGFLRDGLRDHVFAVFYFADEPGQDLAALADALAGPLQSALVEKLRRRFRRDARFGDDQLIRWNAAAALDLVGQ